MRRSFARNDYGDRREEAWQGGHRARSQVSGDSRSRVPARSWHGHRDSRGRSYRRPREDDGNAGYGDRGARRNDRRPREALDSREPSGWKDDRDWRDGSRSRQQDEWHRRKSSRIPERGDSRPARRVVRAPEQRPARWQRPREGSRSRSRSAQDGRGGYGYGYGHSRQGARPAPASPPKADVAKQRRKAPQPPARRAARGLEARDLQPQGRTRQPRDGDQKTEHDPYQLIDPSEHVPPQVIVPEIERYEPEEEPPQAHQERGGRRSLSRGRFPDPVLQIRSRSSSYGSYYSYSYSSWSRSSSLSRKHDQHTRSPSRGRQSRPPGVPVADAPPEPPPGSWSPEAGKRKPQDLLSDAKGSPNTGFWEWQAPRPSAFAVLSRRVAARRCHNSLRRNTRDIHRAIHRLGTLRNWKVLAA
ncbi:unnamed protein product [Effrenium voratum]|nr:unnamed protein product [Effrenium voratum]